MTKVPADTQLTPFSLGEVNVHLEDAGHARVLEGGESFWAKLMAGGYPELERGRLLTSFTFSTSWSSWERHPAGEELVLLLSGAATLLVEREGKTERIELTKAGDFVLVPRSAWHTAQTRVPTTMLFLTPGAGTEHRPVESETSL